MKKRSSEGSGRANRDRPSKAIKVSRPKRAPKRNTEGKGPGDDERPAKRGASFGDKPARPRPTEGRSDERRSSDERPPRKTYGDRPPRAGEGRTFDRPTRAGSSERGEGERRSSDERSPRETYGDRPPRAGEGRTFDRPTRAGSSERGEGERRSSEERPPRKTYGDRPPRAGEGRTFDRPTRSGSSERGEGDRRSSDDRPPRKTYGDRPPRSGEGRTFDRPTRAGSSERGEGERRSSDERPPRKTYGDRPPRTGEGRTFDRPVRAGSSERGEGERRSSDDRPPRKTYGDRPPRTGGYDRRPSKYGGKYGKNKKETSDDGTLRLNRFLSNAGIASRREADTLITAGLVTVNGQVVTELGTKVFPTDDVRFEGQRIKAEKKVYLLLNKPTKFITTTDDPRERDTVMQLIAGACRERLYPVGRLDRNTTGVLLFTNDGDMAKKLTHPSHGAKKLYHVTLNKKLAAADMKKIRDGVMLQEGKAMVDDISYVEGTTTHEVGIEIHIGWNRVVRRIFEELDYEVIKLDRVMFAGLSKKKLPRGHYRFLTEKEVSILKML